MADNIPITAGAGTTVATDDITDAGGAHYQKIKLADGAANSTAMIGGDATNGLDVDVTRLPTDPVGANADAASATGSISAKLRTIATQLSTGATGIPKAEDAAAGDGDLGVPILGVRNDTHASKTTTDGDYGMMRVDPEGDVPICGNVAHDAVDADGPIKIGHKAIDHGTNPTAVAAADRTNWFSNRAGIPFVIGGHPNIVSYEYLTTGAITDDNIMPAIAGGLKYVITSITVIASAANTVNPAVRIGFGTSTLTAQGATNADAVTKIILSHPGIPPGSGVMKGDGGGIVGIGGDGEELRITCGAPTSGSLIVQVDAYTIES